MDNKERKELKSPRDLDSRPTATAIDLPEIKPELSPEQIEKLYKEFAEWKDYYFPSARKDK